MNKNNNLDELNKLSKHYNKLYIDCLIQNKNNTNEYKKCFNFYKKSLYYQTLFINKKYNSYKIYNK